MPLELEAKIVFLNCYDIFNTIINKIATGIKSSLIVQFFIFLQFRKTLHLKVRPQISFERRHTGLNSFCQTLSSTLL